MALRLEVEKLRLDVQTLRLKIFEADKAITGRAGNADVTSLVRDLEELQREVRDCAAILIALGHPVD